MFCFPKWPVNIFSLCLGMYEVISNIFRCSRCSEETIHQDNGLTQLFSYRFLSILGASRSTWIKPDVWTWTICLRFQRQTFQYSKVMQYLLTTQALRLNPFCVSLSFPQLFGPQEFCQMGLIIKFAQKILQFKDAHAFPDSVSNSVIYV